MGATAEEVQAYDPSASPRFIGDEVEPYVPDETQIDRAVSELRLLEAGWVVLGHDNWSYIDGTLHAEESRRTGELVLEDDPTKAAVLRGRILAIQWVRSFPEVVRRGLEENRRAIEAEERGPEGEEDGD